LLFLVVLSCHLQPWPGMVGGQVAMDVFFALSGFLITALIVGERSRTGAVCLSRFYGRRALRLLPALAFFLGVWLTVVAVFGSFSWVTSVPGSQGGGAEPFGTALQGVAVAGAYMSNWWSAFGLFGGYVPLGHLWSLAVEEQFYLLWAPLAAVLLAFHRRIALPVTLVLAAASLLEPLLLWHSGTSRIFFGTDTRAAALLLGCAAAMVWSRGWADRLGGRRWCLLAGTATTALLLSGFGMNDTGSELQWYLGWIGDAAGSAALVLALVARPAGLTSRLLSHPLLTYVGRRSYALYLWHYVWATWLEGLGAAGFPLVVVLSFASAEVSWRLVERRALQAKGRLAPRASPGPTASHPS
jgi:peptidoglycan/LPS O-acetylase OafA/YrhL